jgi:hypothetical protein
MAEINLKENSENFVYMELQSVLMQCDKRGAFGGSGLIRGEL